MRAGTFRYAALRRVVFGRPAAEVIAEEAARSGARRVLLVGSRALAEAGTIDSLAGALGGLCAGQFTAVGAHSPRASVMAIVQAARGAGADQIVAVGGGSVIDACKVALFALWRGVADRDGLDILRSRDWVDPSAWPAAGDPSADWPARQIMAVPTTLSAAEYTWYAGVTDERRRVKESYTHPALVPGVVVLDPALTLRTPPALWLSTGIKALDHAVERVCSLEANPLSDAPALQAIRLLAGALPRVAADPADLAARQDCQFAAWLSIQGGAAGVGVGLSHAIGHVLGAHTGVPHGLTSCVTLPAVMAWNAPVNGARQREVSAALGQAGLAAGAAIGKLIESLALPTRLRDVGIERDAFAALAEKTMADRNTARNPRPVAGPGDVLEVLELAA
ncbi:MAG: iron-containing alcohol dehydrogenase [Hyphomicrobiales bacterium]|nr:iron-containing alcohol dehydrogenase [Hyphomicrobiales bacterium]MCP5372195.1 iron-containing alcohol dehydrogenase [Hyphomicrobiales bacterium]